MTVKIRFFKKIRCGLLGWYMDQGSMFGMRPD